MSESLQLLPPREPDLKRHHRLSKKQIRDHLLLSLTKYGLRQSQWCWRSEVLMLKKLSFPQCRWVCLHSPSRNAPSLLEKCSKRPCFVTSRPRRSLLSTMSISAAFKKHRFSPLEAAADAIFNISLSSSWPTEHDFKSFQGVPSQNPLPSEEHFVIC